MSARGLLLRIVAVAETGLAFFEVNEAGETVTEGATDTSVVASSAIENVAGEAPAVISIT